MVSLPMVVLVIDSIRALGSSKDEGNECYQSATLIMKLYDIMKLYVNIRLSA